MYKIQLKCNTVVVKHIHQLCYKPNIDELNDTEFPIPKSQNNVNVSNNPNEIQSIIPQLPHYHYPKTTIVILNTLNQNYNSLLQKPIRSRIKKMIMPLMPQ